MQQFSQWNKGYRYLLMVFDLFSKYGWIVPLKAKKGKLSQKHSKPSSKRDVNHNIFGLIRGKSIITKYEGTIGKEWHNTILKRE